MLLKGPFYLLFNQLSTFLSVHTLFTSHKSENSEWAEMIGPSERLRTHFTGIHGWVPSLKMTLMVNTSILHSSSGYRCPIKAGIPLLGSPHREHSFGPLYLPFARFSRSLLHTFTLGRNFEPDNPAGYLRLQACYRYEDTMVRFPSSRAFAWAIRCPIFPILKVSSSHFYTWAEFWTSDNPAGYLRLQVCYQ